jgi:hypothetical protein
MQKIVKNAADAPEAEPPAQGVTLSIPTHMAAPSHALVQREGPKPTRPCGRIPRVARLLALGQRRAPGGQRRRYDARSQPRRQRLFPSSWPARGPGRGPAPARQRSGCDWGGSQAARPWRIAATEAEISEGRRHPRAHRPSPRAARRRGDSVDAGRTRQQKRCAPKPPITRSLKLDRAVVAKPVRDLLLGPCR